MSILIKDMKMPKCCADCPLNYDQMACTVTGTRWWSDRMMLMDFESDKERLYDCPLIEVETVDQKELITPLNMIGGYLRRVR